jgi:sortase (surface protein transpeptidase)
MTKWRKYRIGNADKPGGSNDTSRKKKQRDATHESQIYIRQLLAREESLKRKRNEQQEKEQKKAKKKRKHDHPSNEDDEIEVVSATKLDIRCPITRVNYQKYLLTKQ